MRVHHDEVTAAGGRRQPQPPPPTDAPEVSKSPHNIKRPPKKLDETLAKTPPELGAAALLALPNAANADQWQWITILTASRVWLGLEVTHIFGALFFLLTLMTPAIAHDLLASPLAPAPVGRHAADWSSVDYWPLPAWYDEAKVGLFVHGGLLSVPTFYPEWFCWHWHANGTVAYRDFVVHRYHAHFTYVDLAPMITAQIYADSWAELFKKAGLRDVVLTTKHQEGCTLWPSNVPSSWSAADVVPGLDFLDDLAHAVRKKYAACGSASATSSASA